MIDNDEDNIDAETADQLREINLECHGAMAAVNETTEGLLEHLASDQQHYDRKMVSYLMCFNVIVLMFLCVMHQERAFREAIDDVVATVVPYLVSKNIHHKVLQDFHVFKLGALHRTHARGKLFTIYTSKCMCFQCVT